MAAIVVPEAIGAWFHETALGGSMLLALPVAVLGGLASFFSPCVVPLLPGYLSYTTGLSGLDLESGNRGRMLAGASLFVLGFTLVFVSYGALFGILGDWLWGYQETISKVLGALTIVLGVVFLGGFRWFQREARFHVVPSVGILAAPFLGILFGLGWTPCIGPTLSAITWLAMNEGSAVRGSILSLAYCLGLGIPFIVAALAYRRTLGAITWARRHQQLVTGAGGAMLIAIGVLLVTGWWGDLVAVLRPGWASDLSLGL